MVKHIESGKPEHRAIYLWFSSHSHIFNFGNLVKLRFANRAIVAPADWVALMWFPPSLWISHTLRLLRNNPPNRFPEKWFLLTDGLVVGVKEDSDDIAHSPLFTVGFAKSSKDLFLTATRHFDVRTENCFKMSTLIHRKPRRHRLHQE